MCYIFILMISFTLLSFMIIAELMMGLQVNELDSFTHLLTGYVASVSFLEEVYKIVKQLKEKNPNLIYGKKIFYCCFNYIPPSSCLNLLLIPTQQYVIL